MTHTPTVTATLRRPDGVKVVMSGASARPYLDRGWTLVAGVVHPAPTPEQVLYASAAVAIATALASTLVTRVRPSRQILCVIPTGRNVGDAVRPVGIVAPVGLQDEGLPPCSPSAPCNECTGCSEPAPLDVWGTECTGCPGDELADERDTCGNCASCPALCQDVIDVLGAVIHSHLADRWDSGWEGWKVDLDLDLGHLAVL